MYKTDLESDVLNCLKDVINGYSIYKDKWFIKHLDVFEDNDIRSYYESQMEDLTEIPKKEDQESMLIENGIWPEEKESKLKLTKARLEAVKVTLPNILIKAQKEPLEKQADELSLQYLELLSEKNEYMGAVREDVVNQNVGEFLIYKSVYENSNLSEKLFKNMEEVYECTFSTIDSLKNQVFYVKVLSSSLMCKKIACCNTFQALIGMFPKGEEYKVFDKPVKEFTSNQIAVTQYGQVYRSIFDNYEVTDEERKDPEKILEIPKRAENLEKIRQKAENSEGNTSYVGADRSELANMGMGGNDIFSMLKKSGKQSLGKEDLI